MCLSSIMICSLTLQLASLEVTQSFERLEVISVA